MPFKATLTLMIVMGLGAMSLVTIAPSTEAQVLSCTTSSEPPPKKTTK